MASPIGSVYVSLGVDTAQFQSGLKAAQEGTRAFGKTVARAGSDFRSLESSLNPAVAALRQYERAQEVAARAVRLGAATQEEANAVLDRARARYQAATQPLAQAQVGYARFGNAVQQAGFQVGDFAVQVASGQGVLRPFIQQGTQLISMFGPWGAVIGAAGAVVGALAVSLTDAGDASDDADDSLDDLMRTADGLESAIGDLTSIVEAYAQAIRDTAVASDNASARIIANTKAEFAARQQLLRLDTFDARQQQFQRESEIERLRREEAETREAGQFGPLFEEERLRAGIPKEFQTETPALTEARRAAIDRAVEASRQAQDLSRQASRLEATATLAQQQLDEADRILSMTFEEVLAEVEGTRTAETARREAGRSGGGRDRSGQLDSISREIEKIRERARALADERAILTERQSLISLGASPEEIARAEAVLTAEIERQNTVQALKNKALEEGVELTPQQVAEIERLTAGYQVLAIANYDLEAATNAQADAAEKAKEQQEELAKALASVTDRFLSAIQQADSFADALKAVGIEALRLAAQGFGGEGPLGSVLGNVIPALFGSTLAPTKSPIPVPRKAEGGLTRGFAMVGERGRELAYFDGPARIYSNRDTERMLSVGTERMGGGVVINSPVTISGAHTITRRELDDTLARRNRQLGSQVEEQRRRGLSK